MYRVFISHYTPHHRANLRVFRGSKPQLAVFYLDIIDIFAASLGVPCLCKPDASHLHKYKSRLRTYPMEGKRHKIKGKKDRDLKP